MATGKVEMKQKMVENCGVYEVLEERVAFRTAKNER